MSRPFTSQLLRFAAVGTVGFVVDAVVLYAVSGLLGLYVGRVLSFWAAATVTWGLNRRFTFRVAKVDEWDAGDERRWWNEYAGYITAMLAGASLNYLVYVAALHKGMPPIAAVALGSLAGLAVNFCSARWMLLKKKRKHTS